MDHSYETYKTKIFIDSNVILEARPLEDLPWHEIDPTGPILVMLAPTLLREVDSKKRDGRLAVRAREFNRRVAPIASDGEPISLCAGTPQVDIVLAICNKIEWDSYDDLDPSEGDARLIAEVLNVRGVPVEQRIVVSQDINPLFMARRHDLKTYHIPESWLAKSEQGPLEKELAKLKRQVADYTKTEPVFEVQLEPALQPVPIYKVNRLNDEDASVLVEEILSANPKPVQADGPFGLAILSGFDDSLDRRYAHYRDKLVPRFAKEIHSKLEVRFGQIPFKLTLENVGKVLAEDLCVNVQVVGGWFHAIPIFAGAYPSAPKPKDRLSSMAHIFPKKLPFNVGRHEIEVDKPQRSEQFYAQCANFRQGQNWELNGVMWLDPNVEHPATVIVKVTAANYHGEFEKVIKVPKTVQVAEVFDLIDRSTGRGKVDPSTFQLMTDAMDRKDYDAIDWDSENYE